MHTKGHIVLGVTKDPIWLSLQDSENKIIMDRQIPTQKLFQKKPKSTPLPIYLDKSLVDIVASSDSESLVTYIKSVLHKIFPNRTVYHQLRNNEVKYEDIFGSHGYGQRPYEYAHGLLPYDSINEKELTYDVTYLSENEGAIYVKITWENHFESIDTGGFSISELDLFAKQMFYALTESPFFTQAFVLLPKHSYVENIDTYGNRQTLGLIDRHFVTAPATIEKHTILL